MSQTTGSELISLRAGIREVQRLSTPPPRFSTTSGYRNRHTDKIEKNSPPRYPRRRYCRGDCGFTVSWPRGENRITRKQRHQFVVRTKKKGKAGLNRTDFPLARAHVNGDYERPVHPVPSLARGPSRPRLRISLIHSDLFFLSLHALLSTSASNSA